jgi:predicted TIM-barrel fold metal-dependent hydrolase
MNEDLSKSMIDSHFHLFRAGVGVQGARYIPSYGATVEQWRSVALPLGIGRGVLVQPSFMGTHNQALLDTLKSDPELLRGVVVLNADCALSELETLHGQGVRGIRLNMVGGDHSLGSWSTRTDLWDRLIELGWHLELHTDQGCLPEVLRQLPSSLPVVIDHMGKPAQVAGEDPSLDAVCKRNQSIATYVKLSGPYRLSGLSPARLARRWLADLGPERLLWGSDWPHTGHEEIASFAGMLGAMQEWLQDEQVAHLALLDNPQRLYWASD